MIIDEPNDLPPPPSAGDATPDETDVSPRTDAASLPRADDKSPSPGFASTDAGDLPPPPDSSAPRPTPESQAALTGKAPSGSSDTGTTVPSATGDPASSAPSSTQEAAPETADERKARLIADAKARATAAKQAADKTATTTTPAGVTTTAGAPKAPVKKKEEGPKPTDASDHPLVQRLRERLGDAVGEASMFIGQLSVRVSAPHIVEACLVLRDDAQTPFNYLSDLTCVHFPELADAPFEVIYNLYSIDANERVRLKVAANETEGVESVTGVWPAANWMEREVYDLFGVPFKNHPDLRRLLLPTDWEGHPLRKDYPLHFVENNWTTKHLPEFNDVQKEQLEQRRGYGLEILSTPDERRVRDLFIDGKEVMPLDRK